jgi:hypothetical protein
LINLSILRFVARQTERGIKRLSSANPNRESFISKSGLAISRKAIRNALTAAVFPLRLSGRVAGWLPIYFVT